MSRLTDDGGFEQHNRDAELKSAAAEAALAAASLGADKKAVTRAVDSDPTASSVEHAAAALTLGAAGGSDNSLPPSPTTQQQPTAATTGRLRMPVASAFTVEPLQQQHDGVGALAGSDNSSPSSPTTQQQRETQQQQGQQQQPPAAASQRQQDVAPPQQQRGARSVSAVSDVDTEQQQQQQQQQQPPAASAKATFGDTVKERLGIVPHATGSATAGTVVTRGVGAAVGGGVGGVLGAAGGVIAAAVTAPAKPFIGAVQGFKNSRKDGAGVLPAIGAGIGGFVGGIGKAVTDIFSWGAEGAVKGGKAVGGELGGNQLAKQFNPSTAAHTAQTVDDDPLHKRSAFSSASDRAASLAGVQKQKEIHEATPRPEVTTETMGIGAIIGAVIGFVLGGPLGMFIGAALGAYAGKKVQELRGQKYDAESVRLAEQEARLKTPEPSAAVARSQERAASPSAETERLTRLEAVVGNMTQFLQDSFGGGASARPSTTQPQQQNVTPAPSQQQDAGAPPRHQQQQFIPPVMVDTFAAGTDNATGLPPVVRQQSASPDASEQGTPIVAPKPRRVASTPLDVTHEPARTPSPELLASSVAAASGLRLQLSDANAAVSKPREVPARSQSATPPSQAR